MICSSNKVAASPPLASRASLPPVAKCDTAFSISASRCSVLGSNWKYAPPDTSARNLNACSVRGLQPSWNMNNFVPALRSFVARIAASSRSSWKASPMMTMACNRPLLGLLQGLSEHALDLDIAAADALGPAHDLRHVVGIRDPSCRDSAGLVSSLGTGPAVGELHLDSGCCRL